MKKYLLIITLFTLSFTSPQTAKSQEYHVTNNNYYDQPFDYNDYYDNEYYVRLRRFHNNIGGYGYYDSYYTNSYWYTGNLYNYGSSIYMGYNFWGPIYTTFAYSPGFFWSSNLGWGSWNNGGWGGGCGGYYGYNPYMGGYGNVYNQGHWNVYNHHGHFNNFDNNYFNNYNNSYHYGPRSTTSSNGSNTIQPTLSNRYIKPVETETKRTFESTKGRDGNPYLLNDNRKNNFHVVNKVGNNSKIANPSPQGEQQRTRENPKTVSPQVKPRTTNKP